MRGIAPPPLADSIAFPELNVSEMESVKKRAAAPLMLH